MARRDHDQEVADEQATNNNYQRTLQRTAERNPEIAVPTNANWTGTALPKSTDIPAGPLVGRVGLNGIDEIIGADDFYIGPWKDTYGDIAVFSWAAPVAASFYETSSNGYTLDYPVIVRRAFSHNASGTSIIDFDDDWIDKQSTEHDPFEPQSKLAVPSPPPAAKPKAPAPESQTYRRDSSIEEPKSENQSSFSTTSPTAKNDATKRGNPPAVELRAEKALRAALSKPRSSSLPTLLATLQPDQYDFVTRTPTEPLVIQGHPGTGKTVIAAHRAAYLLHPDNGKSVPIKNILMVGPSKTYAEHVSGVLDDLVPSEVRRTIRVTGITQALGLLRRQPKTNLTGPLDGQFFEVSIELGDFAEAVAHELRMQGRLDDMTMDQAGQVIYESVRSNQIDGIMVTDDPDMSRNLKKLPSWSRAKTQKRLHPLVTQCLWAAAPDVSMGFDHVIIDEAQDVRPLEWRLLKEINRTQSWTILGDLNQRRSDWSYASWNDIVRDIEISDTPETFEPETFALGYRSTQQIMNYANKLLPKQERIADNVQTEGPKPLIVKSSASELCKKSIDAAVTLAKKHNAGTTAIITTAAQKFLTYMLKKSWVRDAHDKRKLTRDSLTIYLLTPENSRGLEFDGVVVVEPDSFPKNLGRYGSLYTSLTRANRELTVVYAQSLPDPLRRK